MLPRLIIAILVLVVVNLASTGPSPAQQKSEPASYGFTADYPNDEAGILIQNGDWLPLDQESPKKTRVKRGVAASLSYGSVPATLLSEYAGSHSKAEVHLTKPVICICHFPVLPGNPVLVRLHPDPKHDTRVLDGGRMPVIGAKVMEAKDSDVLPADLLQPENGVWLIRPMQELPEGEYALMFGPQNLAIFTFSVAKPRAIQAPSSK
jgi:hypothetical protein